MKPRGGWKYIPGEYDCTLHVHRGCGSVGCASRQLVWCRSHTTSCRRPLGVSVTVSLLHPLIRPQSHIPAPSPRGRGPAGPRARDPTVPPFPNASGISSPECFWNSPECFWNIQSRMRLKYPAPSTQPRMRLKYPASNTQPRMLLEYPAPDTFPHHALAESGRRSTIAGNPLTPC